MMRFKNVLFVVFSCVLLLGVVFPVQAQKMRNIRGFWKTLSEEYNDRQDLYIGITFPFISYATYSIKKEVDWDKLPIDFSSNRDGSDIDQFSAINTIPGYEIGFGIPVRLRLSDYFSVQTGLNWTAVTTGPALEYSFWSQRPSNKQYQKNDAYNFNFVELPIEFQLRSDYKRSYGQNIQNRSLYRALLFAGISRQFFYREKKMFRDLYEDFDFDVPTPPTIVNSEAGTYHFGLGIEIFFTYFKLSPRISFSQTMGNLLDKERHKMIPSSHANYKHEYMDAIKSLRSNRIQFSLIFE